jgi:hypothetical protein
MPLRYNFGQSNIVIPNVLSDVYRYTKLEEIYQIEMSSKTKISVNSKKRIGDAWKHIETNCGRIAECNGYFAKLTKKMTLVEILKNVTFTVHRLIPKGKYTEEDLPEANSAGLDFALSMYTFLEKKTTEALAATILHEIAHFAGATTNARDDDPKGLDAENSLIPCGLGKYYNIRARG